MNKSILIPFKYLLISSLVLFFSCDLKIPEKEDLASWTIKIEVPMLERVITFEDIIEDSLINPMEGSSLYAFTKEVEVDTVKVGDKLEIDDIHKSFTQTVDDVTVEDSQVQERIGFNAVGVSPINKLITSEIGTITLNDIPEEETEPYTFSSIFPNIDDLPDGFHDIPGFTLEPVENSFSFDDFSNAEFTGGFLTLTILNNLVIPLGETDITLKNDVGTEISGAAVTVAGPITPGQSNSGILNLTGIILPGNIIVEVTGSSPGEDNVEINNDARNSSFTVTISASGLEVSSATAKLPEQIIDENDSIQLSTADSNKVESATILSGKLVISIDNNMAVSSTVNMNISTIHTPGGNPLLILLPIPENETGILHEISLDEHSLIMQLDDQSVYYEYTVITEDSGDDLVTINSTDDIVISLSLEGETPGDEITFSNFTGRVTPQNLGFEGTIEVESDSDILEAFLGSGILEIIVENNVNESSSGAPTAVISIPEIIEKENGDTLNILLEHMSGTVEEFINLSQYKIVMPRNDQNLHYMADVTTNYEEIGTYSLTDSIFIDINVTALSFDEVTGFFSQDAMVDSNSISIDDSTKIETATIKTGELVLDIENNIGIVADIEFKINEFVKNGSTLDTTLSLSSSDNPSYSIDLSYYDLDLDINEDPQTVNYISTINLPEDSLMTLSLNDLISVNVTLTNLTFESVTGNIKPVTVEIEPVVQSIDGLPDEIEDFEFADVNMFIDFDTDIGIPVVLNLEIEASNSSGDIEISTITEWDITDDSRVIIPDAEALINIFPDTIRASGEATVSGMGTVTTSQYVSGIMTVEAPLSFNVPDGTEVDIDIEETVLELDNELLEEVAIFFNADNQFDFGVGVSVFAASDSTLLGTVEEDTLFTIEISSNDTHSDSIDLDNDKIGLFSGEKLFIKADVSISGEQDVDGNPIPSNVLSTDSLNLLLFGRIEVLVDPTEED